MEKVSTNNIEQIKLVKVNFQRWNEALKTKDPKKIAELYADDASFLPTLSSDFKVGDKQAETYFEHFLLKNPVGEIIQERVHFLGEDAYSHSGFYNFIIDLKGSRGIIKARFTFVWGKDTTGNWKILEHHSSLMPTEEE